MVEGRKWGWLTLETPSGKSRIISRSLDSKLWFRHILCPSQRGKISMAMETVCTFPGVIWEFYMNNSHYR